MTSPLQNTTTTCTCGATIHADKIEYWNSCNEEGEDYAMVTADCTACGAYHETSQWGEWESESEAIEHLSNYLCDKKS